MRTDLITLLGPTACGKTTFAAHLAAELNTEIISADSRQVYRRMDIGTGKDLADYQINGQTVPYHLIDIAEPGYKYNLFEYQRDFIKTYNEIKSRNKTPILCGGTGLYIESVLKGYRLSPVPENKELRESLKETSMEHDIYAVMVPLNMDKKTQSVEETKRNHFSASIVYDYNDRNGRDIDQAAVAEDGSKEFETRAGVIDSVLLFKDFEFPYAFKGAEPCYPKLKLKSVVRTAAQKKIYDPALYIDCFLFVSKDDESDN